MSYDYEPLSPEELAALRDADLDIEDGNDLLAAVILNALTRAHASALVSGGSPSVVDPSGWTKSTFPATAAYIARRVREFLGVGVTTSRLRLPAVSSHDRRYCPTVVPRAGVRLRT